MALLSTLALGITLFLVTVWLYLRWREEKCRSQFAARAIKYVSHPNMLLMVARKQRLEVLNHEAIQREGKVFAFPLLGMATILVAEPDLAQVVLSKEFTNFTSRRTIEIDDPFFRSSIVNANGEQWKRLRSVMTPTFSSGKLRRMKPFIDDTIGTLLKNMDTALSGTNSTNVKHLFGAYTMDTVIQVAFGVKVDSLVDHSNPLIRHVKQLFSEDMSVKTMLQFGIMFGAPKLASLLKIRFKGEVLDYFKLVVDEIIARKRAEIASKDGLGKAYSFIELLLEAEIEDDVELGLENEPLNGNNVSTENSFAQKKSKYITNEELISQCVLLFIAGYETTASTITMTAYMLALNQDAQEKLHQEIENMIEKLAQEAGPEAPIDPVKLITVDSLSRFEFLEAVINETLRIYTPAAFTERLASKDITVHSEDGRLKLELKKGDIVHFPAYSMHRDPEQFPEPEVFRPERFVGQPSHHKYSFLPFGLGPRNCIAKRLAMMEAKFAILHTVRVYKLGVCSETKIPAEFYYNSQGLVPKDIVLKLEKR